MRSSNSRVTPAYHTPSGFPTTMAPSAHTPRHGASLRFTRGGAKEQSFALQQPGQTRVNRAAGAIPCPLSPQERHDDLADDQDHNGDFQCLAPEGLGLAVQHGVRLTKDRELAIDSGPPGTAPK